MIVMQCVACSNIVRVSENIMTSLICQKCGNAKFTFDGECEFTSRDGVVTNTDGKFNSANPHHYIVKRIVKERLQVATVNEQPKVKVIRKEEEKEEIELPKVEPLKKPKTLRVRRIRKKK